LLPPAGEKPHVEGRREVDIEIKKVSHNEGVGQLSSAPHPFSKGFALGVSTFLSLRRTLDLGGSNVNEC
jgi:hypothetical protein